MKPQPLIFSASIGHGHHQAATALQHEFQKEGYEPEMIDTFNMLHPFLHKFMLKSYLHLLKFHPKLWRAIYFHAEKSPIFLYLDRFGMLFTNQLYRLIQSRSCPFMISTHPFVTAFLSSVKKKKQLTVPFYTVITDFVLHPAYIRPEINGYFTVDTNAVDFAKHHKISEKLFYPTGIPIRSDFALHHSKLELRKKLGLSEKLKIVLIAGGGMGLTKYTDIIQSINKMQETIQVICMIGHNYKIKDKIKAIPSRHHIQILEFTNDFMLYLKASDAIFTKAGGLTMAESLACETPIIVFNPVPGHEEQNAQMLIELGAAMKVNHKNEIATILKQVLFEKDLFMRMKSKARQLKKPNAANEIVQQILRIESNLR